MALMFYQGLGKYHFTNDMIKSIEVKNHNFVFWTKPEPVNNNMYKGFSVKKINNLSYSCDCYEIVLGLNSDERMIFPIYEKEELEKIMKIKL